MNEEVLKELKEMKKMLQVIVSNQEQEQKDNQIIKIDTKEFSEKLRLESYRF